MRIVHVASEMFPYVKSGGLADVVGALATVQAARGHEVEVYLPGYRALLAHPALADATGGDGFTVPLGAAPVRGAVRSFSPLPGLTVHAVVRDEFFDRRHLYWDGVRDYDDNDARFIFLAKAAVQHMGLAARPVDAVHAHDWQAGLVPLLVARGAAAGRPAPRTVFTIHNIAFQGNFPRGSFALTNLPAPFLGVHDGIEYHGGISLLKAGIRFADRVTTVSATYAREIREPAGGCGMDGVLRARGAAVCGIRNGIDTAVWNPATDPHLAATYSAADPTGKARCRSALLAQCGWAPDDAAPIFGTVSRLTVAKGHDLVPAAADFFRDHDAKLVVVGQGEAALEAAYRALAAELPGRVHFAGVLDETMSHRVIAGSDFFLMPSRTEPCGLTQMYAQAYGTVPLCGRVGGLVDTVADLGADPGGGTGFLFTPDLAGLRATLAAAWQLHGGKDRLAAVRRRGMERDFTWEAPAAAYERLYKGAD